MWRARTIASRLRRVIMLLLLVVAYAFAYKRAMRWMPLDWAVRGRTWRVRLVCWMCRAFALRAQVGRARVMRLPVDTPAPAISNVTLVPVTDAVLPPATVALELAYGPLVAWGEVNLPQDQQVLVWGPQAVSDEWFKGLLDAKQVSVIYARAPYNALVTDGPNDTRGGCDVRTLPVSAERVHWHVRGESLVGPLLQMGTVDQRPAGTVSHSGVGYVALRVQDLGGLDVFRWQASALIVVEPMGPRGEARHIRTTSFGGIADNGGNMVTVAPERALPLHNVLFVASQNPTTAVGFLATLVQKMTLTLEQFARLAAIRGRGRVHSGGVGETASLQVTQTSVPEVPLATGASMRAGLADNIGRRTGYMLMNPVLSIAEIPAAPTHTSAALMNSLQTRHLAVQNVPNAALVRRIRDDPGAVFEWWDEFVAFLGMHGHSTAPIMEPEEWLQRYPEDRRVQLRAAVHDQYDVTVGPARNTFFLKQESMAMKFVSDCANTNRIITVAPDAVLAALGPAVAGLEHWLARAADHYLRAAVRLWDPLLWRRWCWLMFGLNDEEVRERMEIGIRMLVQGQDFSTVAAVDSDFKRFDGSQSESLLRAMMVVYEKFLEPGLVDLAKAQLSSSGRNMRFQVWASWVGCRQSGWPDTSLMNTLVNYAAVSYAFRSAGVDFVLHHMGDDGLGFVPVDQRLRATQAAAARCTDLGLNVTVSSRVGVSGALFLGRVLAGGPPLERFSDPPRMLGKIHLTFSASIPTCRDHATRDPNCDVCHAIVEACLDLALMKGSALLRSDPHTPVAWAAAARLAGYRIRPNAQARRVTIPSMYTPYTIAPAHGRPTVGMRSTVERLGPAGRMMYHYAHGVRTDASGGVSTDHLLRELCNYPLAPPPAAPAWRRAPAVPPVQVGVPVVAPATLWPCAPLDMGRVSPAARLAFQELYHMPPSDQEAVERLLLQQGYVPTPLFVQSYEALNAYWPRAGRYFVDVW